MGTDTTKEKRYGLVGEKLGHSYSPILHSLFGDYDYSLIEISKDEIDAFFEKASFSGVNVTIPYKETAMDYCLPDENAKRIGCVNTLVNDGGSVKGYNTDTYGFEYMASVAGIDFTGMKTVILGSGGTCRTAAYTASRLKAASVTVVSRSPKDMGLELECPVKYVSYDDIPADCEILINTTPVGMYPQIEGLPIDITDNYVNLKAVIDVIYNPLRTRLASRALKRGIKATGGLPMLTAQGFFASKLFRGLPLGEDPVGELSDEEKKVLSDATEKIVRMVENIVITGMPGSGKSTVGRMIAEKLTLDLYDTDALFAVDNKVSPAKFITQNGEKAFRELEKKTVLKAAAGSGRVIATGGGVVLDPENMELLSLNGKIVYIQRRLSELATDDRPLSAGAENLRALYYKRLPIYLSTCDMTVTVEGAPESVADEIISRLSEKERIRRILVINGPNLNMLGIREPGIYGSNTYEDLLALCRKKASELGVAVSFFQSNHEGDLVDVIQQSFGIIDGIVINPGAYTHTSVALLDALKTVGIPTVEVHISDVDKREEFRQISYIRSYVTDTISGHGLAGYTMAMEKLAVLFE